MKKFVLACFFFLFLVPHVHAQDEPVRSIVNVTGDLYRFQNNNHYGVFLVTDEGIILADPINADTATWLKGELKERFDKEVKLVIYSHDHADHISGGEVFADTAIFVAHENAAPKIESSGHTIPPDQTFSKSTGLMLGGKRVSLYFFEPSHSDNLISVYFPDEKALFQVDSVTVKRLPYRNLLDYSLYGTIYSLEKISQLDFDILIPGHGPIGGKDDLIDHREYLVDLQEAVIKALKDGLSLEEAKQKILLEEYQDWSQYENWRELNIEGVYRIFENGEYIPTKIIQPLYPRRAVDRNLCGWVHVKFGLSLDGSPQNIVVVDSEPKEVFDKAAIMAVEKFEYTNFVTVLDVPYLLLFQLPTCDIPPFRDGSTAIYD